MDIKRFPEIEAMSRAVAEFVLDRAKSAVKGRGVFSIALSGGKSPRRLYEMLALLEMPWRETHIFWGDERCVPPDHPDSNHAMANEAMISKAPIPEQNVHRVPVEMEEPAVIAAAYESAIARFFEGAGACSDSRLDLVLLGLGADGHTASLFPGDPALAERARLVVPSRAPEGTGERDRVTLTFKMINVARAVAFVVTGADKVAIVREIAGGAAAARKYPAAMVHPVGDIVCFAAD